MKWQFDYLGKKDDREIFCIISDDGKGNGQGISTRFHYYERNEDGSMKALSYMTVPISTNRPSKKEATILMDKVTRFFNGWIPYTMEVLNK